MTTTHRRSYLQIILAICLFIGLVGNLYSSYGKFKFIFMIIAAGAGIFLLRPAAQLVNRLTAQQIRYITVAVLIAMLVGQFIALTYYPVSVYHDPIRVLLKAEQLSHNDFSVTSNYLWRYPNNVPIAYLLSLWFRFTNLFGMTTNASVHLISILCLDGFILLALNTVRKLTSRTSIYVFALAFFALTPFAYTYFLQVFYTDMPSLLILLAIFRILYGWTGKTTRQKWLASAGLIILGILGEALRASMIVMVPAAALTIVIIAVHNRDKVKPYLVPLAVLLLGICLSFPLVKVAQQQSHFTPNEQYEFPVTSWIAMGLQPDRAGSYNERFVQNQISLPSKQARQKSDIKIIKSSLKQLGVFGTIRQIIEKIGVMLHTEAIQVWYNGGLRETPKAGQGLANFWMSFWMMSFELATILLYAITIEKCLRVGLSANSPHYFVSLMVTLTALGYLAFHGILWEVEGRYGMILVPLLILLNAAMPAPTERMVKHPVRTVAGLCGLATASILVASLLVNTVANPPRVVASQRSQLSQQYGAQPLQLSPGSRLRQTVVLNHKVTLISVLAQPQAQVTATMHRQGTQETYPLTKIGPNMIGHDMPAGVYTIQIANHTNQPQGIDLAQSRDYVFSRHPLWVNNNIHRTWSLVYKAGYMPGSGPRPHNPDRY